MTDTMRAARARLIRPIPRSGPLIDLLRAVGQREAFLASLREGPAPTHAMGRDGRVLTLAEYRSPNTL